MNKRSIGLMIAAIGLALGGLIAGGSLLQTGRAAQPDQANQFLTTAIPPGGLRQTDGDGDSPDISFIDNPSAVCMNPVPNTGACYIQWSYWYVQASSSNYLITMTVEIDGRQRANVSGFFQNYMYLSGDMFGPGFKVVCGQPGASGEPALGLSHSYTIRARETGGLSAANYGSVYCPADEAKRFLPVILR